ncbi:hypothetical protein BJY01DRAFT_149392 [Aspergillus pseudoustus]|uniref:Uncharacterized protein n=1 Tax=Aspergillus pseudoustus TaxID=1810923 RepID=A0ABR4KAV7_9EURO
MVHSTHITILLSVSTSAIPDVRHLHARSFVLAFSLPRQRWSVECKSGPALADFQLFEYLFACLVSSPHSGLFSFRFNLIRDLFVPTSLGQHLAFTQFFCGVLHPRKPGVFFLPRAWLEACGLTRR